MKMSSLLTFGMYPLMKSLFGRPPRGVARWAYGVIVFDTFGQPPSNRVLRACRKLGMSEAEAKLTMRALETRENCPRFVDEEEGERFIELLEDLGFSLDDAYVHESEPCVWDEEHGRYVPLLKYSYCKGCQRKGVRLYRNWNGTHTEYSCSSCGSTDLVNPMEMTAKEIEKHVKAFESLPSGGTSKGSRGAEAEDGSEFESTATRRKYG